MARDLKGVMPALLAPFDDQQRLDVKSLRRLVRFNAGQGVDGLYVGGPTGEALVQNRAKREQVLKIVAEEAKGRVTLIAHVDMMNTEESQQLANAVHRYDFDVAPAVTPFYYPFSFEGYCDHYRAIIDSADGLPMVVYDAPTLSGVKLTLDRINTPVMLLGAGTLKQTSGGPHQMEQVYRAHPDLVLHNGYDEIFVSGLPAGAGGDIDSTHDIMGWCYQGVVRVLKEGDIYMARKLQARCNKVIDLPIRVGVFHGLRTVLHYMDVTSVPPYRRPFAPVDEHCLPELKALANRLLAEKA